MLSLAARRTALASSKRTFTRSLSMHYAKADAGYGEPVIRADGTRAYAVSTPADTELDTRAGGPFQVKGTSANKPAGRSATPSRAFSSLSINYAHADGAF